MKITTKLIVSFLTISLLIVVIGFFSAEKSKNAIEKFIEADNKELAVDIANDIDSYINSKTIEGRLFAESHTPKHFLTEISREGTSPAHPVDSVTEDLGSLVGTGFWKEVHIIDNGGTIQASSVEHIIGTKIAIQEI